MKRLALPDRPSQGWVANQISDRIGEVIGQQAVSYWENGKVNLKNVHPRKLRAYAEVLRITPAELAEAAGYEFAELFPDEPPAANARSAALSAGAMGYRIPKQRPVIPDVLKEAADQYGDLPMFQGIREYRWQHFMVTTPRKKTPQDVEGWLQEFQALKGMGYDPEEPEE
ncbi:helix-turn-helix transcriptional regulator [Deinococcus multiflagellatus]|uniref:Helix-turn-helix transcriptional regulator n=1 Tax=Deinococcus multiflagellatus TaxID=1656887 RepID=A0ABW1ZFS8_9DEIO|nr:helix-turn-helix transcriptional regulator [Deinococcus multiflagellatus]MBZ9712229.1 helix-turn-helix domain-containing protein [Deinococcus multiflagellatus]